MFSCQFREIVQNIFFTEPLRTTDSITAYSSHTSAQFLRNIWYSKRSFQRKPADEIWCPDFPTF